VPVVVDNILDDANLSGSVDVDAVVPVAENEIVPEANS
jgi:hypothetical protein